MEFCGEFCGVQIFFRSTKIFQVPPCCGCACLRQLGKLSDWQGLLWQYYASSNITAVHPKASHADSCNTKPLKRGSCTKYTQRLPSCKILSFIVARLALYTVQIMPLMRKHYSSGSSIHVVAIQPG